jgi:hypothetical protein
VAEEKSKKDKLFSPLKITNTVGKYKTVAGTLAGNDTRNVMHLTAACKGLFDGFVIRCTIRFL